MLTEQKATKKYQRYWAAEAELLHRHRASWPGQQVFEKVLVIPVYDENHHFLTTAFDKIIGQNFLLILVVNQPVHVEHCHHNQQLWMQLSAGSAPTWQRGPLYYWHHPGRSILAVDRFSETPRRIDRRQGVGLARKVGADLAWVLIRNNIVKSSWIYTTDADVKLPADYFQRCQHLGDASAAIYPFTHVRAADDTSGEIFAATRCYENFLNDYVAGLRRANSPYAYHTIGSCMAIDAARYAQARGFPLRSGGEDFYLLNKLNKIAPVTSLAGEPIEILARRSNRAPFGTGPAVEKLLNGASAQTYHGEIFSLLGVLLEARHQLWTHRHRYSQWLQILPKPLQSACGALQFERCFNHLSGQANNEEQTLRQFDQWFDAFKTLKLIHYLEALGYPKAVL